MSGLRYTDYLRGNQTKANDVRSTPELDESGNASVFQGVEVSGGYAVPSKIADGIYEVQEALSPLRQHCTVTRSDSSVQKVLVSVGDAPCGLLGELATRPITESPEITARSVSFGEIYAMPKALQHVLEDASFDVSGWLSRQLFTAFNKVESQQFLTGNGVDAPAGLLNGLDLSASSDADQVAGAYQVMSSDADGSFGATSADTENFLISMQDALAIQYEPFARWMMTRKTYRMLSQGLNELDTGRDAKNPTLLGYPVLFNDEMSGLPKETGSTCPIMLGSFLDGFQIVDHVALNVTRDPYSTHGSTKFYARKRVGSTVLDANAIIVGAVTKA